MIDKKLLMSPKTLEIYEKSIKAIRAIRAEHKKLIKKAKDKTITPEEVKTLRELIKAHNQIEKLRKSISDNHSIARIAVKNATRKKD